jgi:hypothetical protein
MADTAAIAGTSVERRVERLEALIEQLEARVQMLEARSAAAAETTSPRRERADASVGRAVAAARAEELDVAGVLSLIGRTLVVFGGAYLLRALTDTGRLPPAAGVTIGLLYAVAWLAVSLRAARAGRPASAAFHAVAGLLIGCSLLWEASTRFRLLGAASSATALAAVIGVGLAVAWRTRLQVVAGAATVAALVTAVALMAGFGQVAPFALFLVALGIATLWLGYDRDWYWLRWPTAMVADIVVLGLVARASARQRLEPAAIGIAVPLLLLVSYLASVAARTLVRGRVVIPFEIVQSVAALVIGLGGALAVARVTSFGEGELGGANALLGAGTYAVAFAFVERRQGLGLNFYFYATLALVLTLVGTSTLLATPAFVAVTAALAFLTTLLAFRERRLALALHGSVYCVAAAGASGLLVWSVSALVGSMASPQPSLAPGWWVALAAPFACLAIPRPAQTLVSPAVASIPRVAIALLLVVTAGGTLVHALAPMVAGWPPDPGTLATLRTAIIAIAAVLLAVACRYDCSTELGSLMYPVLIVGGAKLLLEDFAQSDPATLFIAFAAYGTALVAAPRLAKRAPVPSA